jgi:quercetin dioxygenase-like cupin family protein
MTSTTLSASLRKRLIRKSDLVANDAAFIDYRIPGCTPKHNYALIGPGVSQGTKQFVNLQEPHGFNVGAVNVPHGVVNPPHLHFTAEVFICYRGHWAMTWGAEGENELRIGEGDLMSVPTWIYRGFRNVGVDDGFLFAVLGRDESGGIMWAPSVVRAAQANGLYLTDDDRMIDVTAGEKVQPTDRLFEPMSEADLAALRRYSIDEMSRYVVRHSALAWSSRALLGAIDAGVELAPAIGYGISEEVRHAAPINEPRGFSIEWLRLAPGARVPRHRVGAKQVLIAKSAGLTLAINDAAGEAQVTLNEWDTFSIPNDAWRSFHNAASTPATVLVVTAGDSRKPIEWPQVTRDTAAAAGFVLDADRFVAPRKFVERTAR